MYGSPPTRRVSALISAPQPPSYRGYLLIPGPGPAPLPPEGAPLLGLMSCPESAGAEMEAGAPAAGTPGPACPAWPSPSKLASFPIASGAGSRRGETVSKVLLQLWWQLGWNSALLLFRHHHLQFSILHGARALTGSRERADAMGGNSRGRCVRALAALLISSHYHAHTPHDWGPLGPGPPHTLVT